MPYQTITSLINKIFSVHCRQQIPTPNQMYLDFISKCTWLTSAIFKFTIIYIYIGTFFCSSLLYSTNTNSSKVPTRLLGTSALILFFSGDTPIHTALEYVTKKIHLDADDVRISAGISCALWAISTYIPHQQTKEFLQIISIALPTCAVLLSERIIKKINTIPIIKHSVALCEFCSHLPLLDNFFECTNKECNSICTQCKLRRSYQLMPLIAGIYAGILRSKAYYHYHYTPLKSEFIQLINAKETCSICLEEYTTHRLPIQLHQDKTSHIKHYICTECYNEAYVKHRTANDIAVTAEIDGIMYHGYDRDPTPCSHCTPKCPLCKQVLDAKNTLCERLEYAIRYQKKAIVR